MKTKAIRARLKQRREAFDKLKDGAGKARTRPGSLNPRKTGSIATNGGTYQRSGRKSSSGSARRRSKEAVQSRGGEG